MQDELSRGGSRKARKYKVGKENQTGQWGELGSCIRTLDRVLYTFGNGSPEAFCREEEHGKSVESYRLTERSCEVDSLKSRKPGCKEKTGVGLMRSSEEVFGKKRSKTSWRCRCETQLHLWLTGYGTGGEWTTLRSWATATWKCGGTWKSDGVILL